MSRTKGLRGPGNFANRPLRSNNPGNLRTRSKQKGYFLKFISNMGRPVDHLKSLTKDLLSGASDKSGLGGR